MPPRARENSEIEWRLALLGELCKQDRQMIEADSAQARKLPYIGLENVESNTGCIARPMSQPQLAKARSTTFQFDNRHVLYGKLRPYLNKVATPDFEGRCTTELIPLLPSDGVSREYLAWVLRRPETVEIAMRDRTGSRMPRADMNRLLSSQVPIPPMAEQKRIVAALNEQMTAVQKARAATEAQLVAAKVLPAAYLREVFDSREAQKWPKKRLEQACCVVMGQSPKGDSYNSESLGVPLLNGPTEFGGVHPVAVQWTTSPIRYAEKGDVLLCVRGATTGRMNIADQQYCIGRGLAAIRPADHNLDSTFLKFALKNITAEFLKETAGSTFPNLPGEKLNKFTIAVPRLETQVEAATALTERLKRAQALLHSLIQQLSYLEHSPTAFLDAAFAGRL